MYVYIVGPAIWYAGQMEPRVGYFSQFAYFLVTPTLLYRDHYPRYIDLHNVFLNHLQHVQCHVITSRNNGINYRNIVAYFMQVSSLC